MISESDYVSRDATALAELVRKREVTPFDLLETALARTERLNPQLNAIVTLFEHRARAQIEAGLGNGPLAGVPFLLKDLRASLKGERTTGGNAFMATEAVSDSEVVSRIKASGMVIFGKTNIPEMGLAADCYNSLFGRTRNPWSAEHTPGGSSGGSAAAVAARIVPIAHASDGAGSTRIPSSCCGVFGLKTTRGRVTYGPDVGEELIGMSTQHATSVSVRDSAAMLDLIGKPMPGDPYTAPQTEGLYVDHVRRDPGKLRIALSLRPPISTDVHEDCIQATLAAARLCEDLGHDVIEADHGIDFEKDKLNWALKVILGTGMYTNVLVKARSIGLEVDRENFLPGLQQFLEAGRKATAADYYLATRYAHAAGRRMAAFHEHYDIVLSPMLSKPPLPVESFDYHNDRNFADRQWDFPAYAPLYNMSGQPAMTVPLHWNSGGLPIGVQFAAPFGREDMLFSLAGQLERAAPWANRLPPVV